MSTCQAQTLHSRYITQIALLGYHVALYDGFIELNKNKKSIKYKLICFTVTYIQVRSLGSFIA